MNITDQRETAPRGTVSVESRSGHRPHVVIVGGGFAGLAAASALDGHSIELTVIDRRNYSLFQPLLYQVATAALSPADVAAPIRALLHAKNTKVLLDEIIAVAPNHSRVRTKAGREISYDYLILATGSQYDYFGHDDWAPCAPAPKTLEDALEIRRRLLLAFEIAELTGNDAERRALMTFVVVGAGPTGVEMAGAIAELAKATLVRDFRHIDPASANILLIEAGAKVLSAFPEELGAYAQKALTQLGVEILLNTRIEEITETGVLAGIRWIPSRVVIWAAGVSATPVAAWLGVRPVAHGAVGVNLDFSFAEHPEIFVIGDAAAATSANGTPLPKLAAAAKQEGAFVAALIRSRIDGSASPKTFLYRDYGTMATIGRSAAVADIRGFQFTGILAWVLWSVVHIYYLIGFRNRLAVFLNWCWAWFTYARGARLIHEQAGHARRHHDQTP